MIMIHEFSMLTEATKACACPWQRGTTRAWDATKSAAGSTDWLAPPEILLK